METLITSAPRRRDLSLPHDTFAAEVLEGLSQPQKSIPAKFFYDGRGSQLFDEICELEAYYPTRTEVSIMQQHVDEMIARLGQGVLLVEYGSGSSVKTRILLDHLVRPAGYVPIDISKEHLLQSASALAATYPHLDIYPVSADYSQDVPLPGIDVPVERVVVYFPGSTIGNFDTEAARGFLERIAKRYGSGAGLLIGVDLQKDVAVLEAAYDDLQGVTAAFNKNLLVRMNRELDADFDLERFAHRAFYNAQEGRIEMHLVSLADQHVTVAGERFAFADGESIHTENSYKYTLDGFAALAASAGWCVEHVWTDAQRYFSVQLLVVE